MSKTYYQDDIYALIKVWDYVAYRKMLNAMMDNKIWDFDKNPIFTYKVLPNNNGLYKICDEWELGDDSFKVIRIGTYPEIVNLTKNESKRSRERHKMMYKAQEI